MRRMKFLPLVGVAILVCSTACVAEDAPAPPPDEPITPAKEAPAKENKKLGSDDAACHTFARAGFPQSISKWATPTDSCGYCWYAVGGGSAWLSESPGPPSPELGTWGRDWCGRCLWHPWVMLGWGGHYQGGTGAYRGNGPTVCDPVTTAIALPEDVRRKREERKCGVEGE